jgi:hypothetical protein
MAAVNKIEAVVFMGFSVGDERYTKDQILRNRASAIPPRINEIAWAGGESRSQIS